MSWLAWLSLCPDFTLSQDTSATSLFEARCADVSLDKSERKLRDMDGSIRNRQHVAHESQVSTD